MFKCKMRAGCLMMIDKKEKRRKLVMQYPVILSGDIGVDQESKQRADKIINKGLINMAYRILGVN